MDIISVTKQFVAFYYETFQSNRSNLGQLYVRFLVICYWWLNPLPHQRDNSTLSFEGIVCLGGKNIIEKYTVSPTFPEAVSKRIHAVRTGT